MESKETIFEGVMEYKISIFDAITNETIERDMTKDEIEAHVAGSLEAANDAKKREAEATAKAAEKAALLAKLGITADEAALLLS
jgi:hypothetical protein